MVSFKADVHRFYKGKSMVQNCTATVKHSSEKDLHSALQQHLTFLLCRARYLSPSTFASLI